MLKFIVVWMMKKLDYKTTSEETRMTMILVFIIQYLNTGPLLVLSFADLKESSVPFVRKLFRFGQYTDFGVTWYRDVGKQIMSGMLLNMVWP